MQRHARTMARLRMGTNGWWNGDEQPDRPVATRARGRGRTGRSEDLIAGLTPGSGHCTGKPANRVARGGTQGGLNCLTHALPRCLSTPNSMEADGNGYGAITGRGGSLGPPLRESVNLQSTVVPLLWTGVPTRHDKNICRCFGAPACRVFSNDLITSQ